jgi:hypothetical protein
MTATLFRAPFRELLARDRKTVLDGEIAEPDFWAAVCVSGARLIDDLRDFTDASTLLRLARNPPFSRYIREQKALSPR